MTKKQAIKWWNNFKKWQKVGLLLSPFAGGGEVLLVINHAHWAWHGLIVVATIICMYTTKIFTDIDGDGIIDQFQ